MSLISDALEKARREAQERDGRSSYPIRSAPARPRSPWPWLAAVAASLGLGLVLGMVLLSSGTEPAGDASTAAAPGPAVSAADDDPLAAPPTESSSEENLAAGDAGIEGPPRPEADRPGARSLEIPPEPPHASPHGVVADEDAVEPPRPADPPSTERRVEIVPDPSANETVDTGGDSAGIPGPVEGETYRQSVRLPDGSRLALRGIAWHATEPAALLGDRVFGIGDGLDDWTVVAVERGRVQIEWRGVRFYLGLK